MKTAVISLDEETLQALFQLTSEDMRTIMAAMYRYQAEDELPELDDRMQCIFELLQHITFLNKSIDEMVGEIYGGD